MEKEDNSTVKSLRAPQETFEKLKAIAADNQLGSQGEALTALIRLWEVNKAKVAVPDRATEIETFRSYLNKIEDAYIHSLEVNVAAEASKNTLPAALKLTIRSSIACKQPRKT